MIFIKESHSSYRNLSLSCELYYYGISPTTKTFTILTNQGVDGIKKITSQKEKNPYEISFKSLTGKMVCEHIVYPLFIEDFKIKFLKQKDPIDEP